MTSHVYFFDDTQYIFENILIDINMTKHVVLALNNKIKHYTDKQLIFELIFNIFTKYKCKIYLITLHPTLCINKICSRHDLIKALCNLQVTYKKYNNHLVDLVDTIENIILKENYIENCNVQNIVMLGISAGKFSDKYSDIVLRLSNIYSVETTSTMFSHLCKKNNVDITDELELINNTSMSDMIYYMWGIFCNEYPKNELNNINIDGLSTLIEIYTQQNNKNKGNEFNVLVNFAVDLIKYYEIRNTFEMKYFNNLNVTHIPYLKYKKMNKSLKIKKTRPEDNTLNIIRDKLLTEITTTNYIENVYISQNHEKSNNWKYEISKKSCVGMKFNLHISGHNKIGKLIDDIIQLPTNSKLFGSVVDYLDELNNNESFNGNFYTNKQPYNTILPVYINKYHWQIAKQYVPITISTCITNTSVLYGKHMTNIYYVIMTMEFNKLSKIESTVEKRHCFYNCMILFRTCVQISKENGHHKGIKKYIDSLSNNIQNIQPAIVLGQLLSTDMYADEKYGFDKLLIKFNVDTKSSDYKHQTFNTYAKIFNLMSALKNKVGGFNILLENMDVNGGLGYGSENY